MAQQVINIGSAPNDGTGDQLRTAFDKCNDNFTELYAGSGGGGVPYTGATQNVDLGEYELKAGQFTLDTSPTGTASVGTTRWNDTLGSTETTLKGGSVILKNGVDLVARVVNKVTPNATLTKAAYQAVRVSGAQGQRLAVAYAQANNDNNSADTIGLVCETIATNQEGFIITVGQLEGINTTGSLQGETWADGDVIYLSPTTPGALTKVKPTAPGHIVIIGYVEYAHAINGKLYVKIMNGWELDELHNVNISSPTNNQILAYTSSTQLWENKSVGTALGFTPENVANKSTNLTSPDNTKYPTTLAVSDALNGKINLNSWIDYSATSTIVGFSSISTRNIRYLVIGDLCTVFVNIQGTSNTTTFTYTLPFVNTGASILTPVKIQNNGGFPVGLGYADLAPNSSTVTLYSTITQGGWSATNAKGVWYLFSYKIN
jgi:nitrogen fixation protein